MKLIGIDLDGTLLNSQQKISEINADALRQVAKAAFPFICSGREVADIKNILAERRLTMPIVGLNGAIGFNGDEKLFDFHFNYDSMKALYLPLSKYPTKIYTNLGSYESQGYKDQLKKIFAEIGTEFSINELNYELEYEKSVQSTTFKSIKEVLTTSSIKIYKFFVFIPNKIAKKQLKANLKDIPGITVTESAPVNIEIVPNNVSKGLVFSHLQRIYNFESIKTFAIGDSLNDLTLFEHADYGFAMCNGNPLIKNIATYITPSNENNGVAYALQKIATI